MLVFVLGWTAVTPLTSQFQLLVTDNTSLGLVLVGPDYCRLGPTQIKSFNGEISFLISEVKKGKKKC